MEIFYPSNPTINLSLSRTKIFHRYIHKIKYGSWGFPGHNQSHWLCFSCSSLLVVSLSKKRRRVKTQESNFAFVECVFVSGRRGAEASRVSASTVYNQTWGTASADHIPSCSVISHTWTPVIDLISSISAVSRADNQDGAVITPLYRVLAETTSNAELNRAWNLDLIAWLRADCNWPHWELMVDWTMASRMLNAADLIFNLLSALVVEAF